MLSRSEISRDSVDCISVIIQFTKTLVCSLPTLPEVWHAGVLPDIAVGVPPDVRPRPGPHVVVVVLEAAGPGVLVAGVSLTSSRLAIA